MTPSQGFCWKNSNAKPIINQYDYINMNAIKITMVIILNYRYGINITEQGKIVKLS